MAVDRGYGSGKPRSAANSAARRTRAASANLRKKNIQNQASKPGVRLGVSRMGKTENAGFNIGGRKYLETGVSANKLSSVAKALFESGRFSAAEVVGSRLHAKRMGAFRSRNLSGRSGKTEVSKLSPRLLSSAERARYESRKIFKADTGPGFVQKGSQAFDNPKPLLKELGKTASKNIAIGRNLRGVAGEANRKGLAFRDARGDIKIAKDFKNMLKNSPKRGR